MLRLASLLAVAVWPVFVFGASGGFRRAGHKTSDRLGGLGLHARDHVSVLLERERRGRVTEAFAHDLDRHPGPQPDRGVRVPQVVESDPLHTGTLDPLVEHLAYHVGVDHGAVCLAEDQFRLLVSVAVFDSLMLLCLPVLREDRDRSWIDVDHPGTVRLRRRDLELVGH